MAKDHKQLWKEVTSASDEAQAVRILAGIVADKEGRTFVSRLDGEDASLCVRVLDQGITKHNLKPAEKQYFFLSLRKLAERHGILPDRMVITGEIEVSDEVIASGGFAYIRSGTYAGGRVAVKTVRVTVKDDFLKIRKRFSKEVVLWSTLSHPNVMTLTGIRGDMEKGQFSIVSEWMERGNIMEFIEKNPTNRLELLYGAAQGLKYLHVSKVMHGDLKGANILISNETPPRALLTDFGFTAVVPEPAQPMAHSAELEGGAMTFMSPELLVPEEFGLKGAVITTQADIYAFGLVIFQVLTGEIPFRGVRQSALAYHVLRGKRPEKPENAAAIGFSDPVWDFAQQCWDGDMKLRPEVGEVVTHLKEAASNWNGLMPPQSKNVEGGITPSSVPERSTESPPASEGQQRKKRRGLVAWFFGIFWS